MTDRKDDQSFEKSLEEPREGSFISRWSRRKTEARTGEHDSSSNAPSTTPLAGADSTAAAQSPSASKAVGENADAKQIARDPLPPVQSLTPDSDFSPFARADVDPKIKNQAFKTLFKDPHFNVMDGLDTYIDDYSKPDPIPDTMLRAMNQAKSLFLFEEKGSDKNEDDSVQDPENGANSAEQDCKKSDENLEQNDVDASKCLAPTNGDRIEPGIERKK